MRPRFESQSGARSSIGTTAAPMEEARLRAAAVGNWAWTKTAAAFSALARATRAERPFCVGSLPPVSTATCSMPNSSRK